MRKLSVLLMAVVLSGPACAAPDSRVQFEFHSSFLLNLHHFLYDSATRGKKRGPSAQWQHVRTPADRIALEEAAAFYARNYLDSALLGDEMNQIKVALSVEDTRQSVRGLALPAALSAVLERAAPAYARTIWPVHERANRLWIRQTAALDTAFGEQIEGTIERQLRRAFPARIRVDAVFDTGTYEGAYTSDQPQQAIIPSNRADYQGFAALEMLYHEATHTGVIDSVVEALDARLKVTGRSSESMLWHAVHFYTVGEVVKDVLKQRANIAYLPYADQGGLFNRAWGDFVPLLSTIWRPYLEGQSTFEDAANAMVDRLPAK